MGNLPTPDSGNTGTTNSDGMLNTVKSTIEGLFSNEYVKLGVAGVGGFALGYITRLIQGFLSKKSTNK